MKLVAVKVSVKDKWRHGCNFQQQHSKISTWRSTVLKSLTCFFLLNKSYFAVTFNILEWKKKEKKKLFKAWASSKAKPKSDVNFINFVSLTNVSVEVNDMILKTKRSMNLYLGCAFSANSFIQLEKSCCERIHLQCTENMRYNLEWNNFSNKFGAK